LLDAVARDAATLPAKALGAEQAAIDPDVGAFDRNRADGLGIIIGGTDAADDGIAVAGMFHVFQAGKQQRRADTAFASLRVNSGRTEKIPAGDVVAGKAKDVAVLDGDEAGHRLAAESDLSLARPIIGEVLLDPGNHLVLLGRQRPAQADAGLCHAL